MLPEVPPEVPPEPPPQAEELRARPTIIESENRKVLLGS